MKTRYIKTSRQIITNKAGDKCHSYCEYLVFWGPYAKCSLWGNLERLKGRRYRGMAIRCPACMDQEIKGKEEV